MRRLKGKAPYVIDAVRKALKRHHVAKQREYTVRKISTHPAHCTAGLHQTDFLAAAPVVAWASYTKHINHWLIHDWCA